MKLSEEIAAAIDELRKHGAVVKDVVTGGKHGKVIYEYQGQQRFITGPLSGSDWRGPLNARADVRFALGIKRGKKVGARRVRKDSCRVDHAELPERLTPGRDPFAVLRAAAALKLSPDQAWARYFGTLLRDHGHEPISEAMR